ELSDISAKLSFVPLIKKIREIKGNNNTHSSLEPLLKKLDGSDLLQDYISDISILSEEAELFNQLMSLVFSPLMDKTEIRGAFIPFTNDVFYSSSLFKEVFQNKKNRDGLTKATKEEVDMRLFYAYFHIAKAYYDLDLIQKFSKVISITDSENLSRFYDMKFDPSYIEVTSKKETKPFTENEKKFLKENAGDLKAWQSLINLDDFEFKGFVIVSGTDVTDDQIISNIREMLLSPETILSHSGFLELQNQIRSLLKLNSIFIAVGAINDDKVFILNKGVDLERRNKYMAEFSSNSKEFEGCIFQKVYLSKKEMIIHNLDDYENKTKVEEKISSNGIKNLYLAPLINEDNVIGLLEIFSSNPGDMYPLNIIKLKTLIPLFSVAVKRILDDINREVQVTIQEKYTAIHPSVAWKFKESAFKYLRQTSMEEEASTLDDIIFPDVYPLYAMSDIRGSSDKRNTAIRQDLVYQLHLIQGILKKSYEVTPLSFTDNLFYKLEKSLSRLETEIHTGDEGSTIDFFVHEIDPALDKLIQITPEIKEAVDFYKNSLDPVHRVIYDKRKKYDEDITKINLALSEYIDKEEEKVQKLYPHYFEKNATDGVDFSIYIGESIVEKGFYDDMYIKDLRIWQLKVLCGLSKVAEEIKSSLNDPLDVAHLTLVQNMPLTIQYMFDDKQFVVNGSYNIRYEILKKRIDKAKSKRGGERITQPGKIAIIYSQPREGEEYRSYLEYLISRKYLHPEIEELEVEDLQGVSGLMAFRVRPII
ncbi:MAG: hypothetical protein KDK36_06545, partial [Leptospiraceae bacterium]|nr:hypothetical protein [Leptospiraceae bacterium]